MENKVTLAQTNSEQVNQSYQNKPYNPYIKSKKIYKPMDKKDVVFMIVFLIISFLLVDFAFCNGFHLGFTIFYFILFIASTIYISQQNKQVPVFSAVCGALSLLGSITFALYSDYFINSIMFVLIGGLYTLYCIGISCGFNHKQGSFKILIDLILSAFAYPFKNIPEFFGSAKSSAKKNKRSLNGMVGAAVAIPVLVVIIPLLIKSDAAFEGLVSTIAKNIGIYLLEFLFAVVIAPYIFSFVFGKRKNINKKKKEYSDAKSKKLPVSACSSFLSVISLTYLVYLFSQLAYFFSAFKGFLPDGYEYSASVFARRGFFEMFIISIINIAIISGVSMFAKKKSLPVKFLSLFISLFSVLLIVTAMQKMRLNISIYGLSKNRLLVCVFMIMLLVIIAFFIIHIFAPKISYMQPIIIICSAMFIVLSFADVDAQIAKYNINAYESGRIDELDIDSIVNLSDSAVEYLLQLSQSEDTAVSIKADRAVINKIRYVYYDSLKLENGKAEYADSYDFRQYHYSKDNACRAIADYINALKEDDREKFMSLYQFETGDYDYLEDEDAYYLYGTDYISVYTFDNKKGMYELSEKNEYDYNTD